MYVDPTLPSASSMKTEQDVNEATAALKGLLGLGGTPSPAQAREGSETALNSPPPTTDGTARTNAKKKRNNNKKKKVHDNPRKEPETTKDNVQIESAPSSKKKRKPRKKSHKEPETYALSAFQSSPDASKLPIPEFASPVTEKQALNPEEVTSLEVLSEHSAEQQTDTLESTVDRNEKGEIDKSDASSSEEKEADVESRNDAPVSTTGVNLAALAAKPPQSDPVSSSLPPSMMPPYNTTMPQQPMHLNQMHFPPHFGAGLPPPTSPHLSPTHMPYPHHPQFGFTSPLIPPHQYQPPHLHHPYPPPPPPGYILISVQVPPVLMPGRQMIVTAPSGFPVQVVVPEGVPGGAWMPVHVPANPPHMHPHHLMPQSPPPLGPPPPYDPIDDQNNNQYTPP